MIPYDGFRIAFDDRGGEVDFGPSAVLAIAMVACVALLVVGAIVSRALLNGSEEGRAYARALDRATRRGMR